MNTPFRFRSYELPLRSTLSFAALPAVLTILLLAALPVQAEPADSGRGTITKETGGTATGLDSASEELTEAKKRFRKFRGYAEFLFDSIERMNGDFIIEMREIENLAEGEKILMAKYRAMAVESKFIDPLEVLVRKFDGFYSDVDQEFSKVEKMSLKFTDKREREIYTAFLRAIEDDRKGIDGFMDEFKDREKFIRDSYTGLKSIFDGVRYEDGALVYKPGETGKPASGQSKDEAKKDDPARTPGEAKGEKGDGATRVLPKPHGTKASDARTADARTADTRTADARTADTRIAVSPSAVPGTSKTAGTAVKKNPPEAAGPAQTVKETPPPKKDEPGKTGEASKPGKAAAESDDSKKVPAEAVKSSGPTFEKLPPRVPANQDNTRPICVIIENHKGARPQSGLHLADVVFEILAEGGITRFLGVFHTENKGIVGPVRSCRHYLTDLSSWFDGILVHCGSSTQGLQAVAARGVDNMNEIAYGPPFYRVNFRKAPHNLYTTLEKIWVGVERLGWRTGTDAAPPPSLFPRSKEPFKDGGTTLARIAYHKNYGVAYIYDQETNTYLRTMAGAPHLNHGTKEQLRADNVLVIQADTTQIDDYGRLDIVLTGTGRAMLFAGGLAFRGRWHKPGVRDPMTFTLDDGEKMLFNPGNIWVQVIRESTRVTPSLEASK